jgi:hypothetical protein
MQTGRDIASLQHHMQTLVVHSAVLCIITAMHAVQFCFGLISPVSGNLKSTYTLNLTRPHAASRTQLPISFHMPSRTRSSHAAMTNISRTASLAHTIRTRTPSYSSARSSAATSRSSAAPRRPPRSLRLESPRTNPCLWDYGCTDYSR